MGETLIDELAKLNQAQLQAVKKTDGPMLVLAGPGTGKTQLLSSRVAYILNNTDTKPSEILCLTFTNKATVNMRERIIELVGQVGTRVPTATFHSFAAEIMNLYPDSFWNSARLTIAPEAVQLDIVESIIEKLPLDNPLALKFAGQYTLLRDVQQAIKLAKDAGLTPAKLRAITEFNLGYIEKIESQLSEITTERITIKKLPALAAAVEDLTTQEVTLDYYPLVSLSQAIVDQLSMAIEVDLQAGNCSQTSRWKSRWIQTIEGRRGMFSERSRNEWWLNLSEVYQDYRQTLHKRGFYDYADMLVEVVSVLEQDSAVLADIQERFSYVLIDEFQDSTPAQLRLAHLVADTNTAEGKPNLMVVGDDDQTIYKFNGAEVNNMMQFEQRYPDLTKVVLTDNYRSSQEILDFAKKVIEQADTRLVKRDPSLTKELRAKNPPKDAGQIRVLAYAGEELQHSQIARDIQSCYKPGREIAILARSHKSLLAMAGILQQLKVPIRYEQASNILDHPIVSQVYLVAKLVIAIHTGDKAATDALIHQIIRWPVWGLNPKKLWRIAASNFGSGAWLDSLLDSQDKDFKRLGEWFVWLAQASEAQPLAITIEQILGLRKSEEFCSPIRDHFRSSTKEAMGAYFHGLSAIQLLRNLAHEFGTDQQPTIIDLVRFVEVNQQNGIVVPDESPFISGEHAVQLLTVHKAKGLEFDEVYIVDAIDSNWRPKVGGRRAPANLPLQPVGDDLDDFIRLMYVAITRARSNVTISGYHQDHSGRDVSLSSIILGAHTFDEQERPAQPNLIETLEESLHWPDLEHGEEKAILKAKLETYSLSPTHLLSFLDVTRGGPTHFKERVLLELPYLKNVNQALGTALHAALEIAQIQVNQDKFKLSKIIETFGKSLRYEQLEEAEHIRQLGKGEAIINNLFTKYKYALQKGGLPEQRIRGIKLGDATINGKLDRVDKGGQDITIVDYKSGATLTSFDSKDKNQAIRAYKHRLQLIFYTLLARQHPNYSRVNKISGQMVYLEADSPRNLIKVYEPTSEDIDHLTRLIQAVWRHIQNLDMPDTSGYSRDITGILEFERFLLNEK